MHRSAVFALSLVTPSLITLTAGLMVSGCASMGGGDEIQISDPKELLLSSTREATVLGDADAPIKVAVFHDTNCGMCRKMWREVVNGSLKEPIARGEVAYRFVEFPLGLAPNSSAISIAAKCAGEQGKFREFLDAVYTTKGEHGESELTELSHKAGVDTGKLSTCINSGRGKELAKFDVAVGQQLGIQGTPTFFINGEELKRNWTDPATWSEIAGGATPGAQRPQHTEIGVHG